MKSNIIVNSRLLRKVGFVMFLLISLPSVLLSQVSKSNKPAGELLLKSGFEEGVNISEDMKRILGSDISGFDWSGTPSWIESCQFVYIVGRDAKLTDFMESAIEKQVGPHGNRTNVLRMTNKADDEHHHATSRNEFSFFGKKPPNDYKEGYVRYRMKLQSNLTSLVPFDERSPFYMIMEWKEPNSRIRHSAEECEECCDGRKGGTNNFRINIGITKNANSNQLFWTIRGEHPQPCRKELWRYEGKDVKVPLGEWFLVEAYMKRDAKDGRVYFAVNNQVVIDTDVVKPEGFTGGTQHPDNPLPLRFWSPMKNYHGMDWNKEGPVSQWYDDFELWSSFPPGHAEWED